MTTTENLIPCPACNGTKFDSDGCGCLPCDRTGVTLADTSRNISNDSSFANGDRQFSERYAGVSK